MTEWRPIETAPKDGTEILAVTDYGLPATMKWRGGKFVRVLTCRRCDGMGLGGLTHWMPIPDRPEGPTP